MDVSDSHIIEAFSDYLATHIPEHSFVFPVSDEVAHPLLYRILAQKNPENFQLLRGSQVLIEEIDTRWNQNGSPIVIEIDDQFLQRFVTNDSVRIGGPFIVPARDSISAIQLESAFIQHFSPEALESENLTRLDRLSFARIWSRRGVYWFHLNRMSELMGTQSSAYLKQAIFNFKAACSFDPFSLEGALHASNLAIALTKTGDMEEAKKIALQALALSPDAPDAYRALYLIAVKNQAYDTALTHLVKLSALRPKDGETRINIAALLILLNRIDEARTEYRRGIERGGKPRDALETILSPGHSSE